jgi:hypothetical protein
VGQLKFEGNLIAGPPSINGDGYGMQVIAPVTLKSAPSSFDAASGVLRRSLSVAAPAWGPLQGVGPTDTVTQGTFLYVRTTSLVLLRLTTNDGAGGTVVELNPVDGLYVREFGSQRPLELLEVQGTATIEYFVSGPR